MSKFSTYKVKLNPTPEQKALMCIWGEHSRDLYDYTLSYLRRCYYESEERLKQMPTVPLEVMSEDDLIKKLRSEQVIGSVYSSCPHSICDGAIRKAYHDVQAFENERFIFRPKCSYQRKGLGRIKISFSLYPRDVCFTGNKVRIHKLGVIKLAEKDRIPTGTKFKTPGCVFDGRDWYITVNLPANDSPDATQKSMKPYIRLTDDIYINLISEFDRLGSFLEVCERKKPMSQNWHRAKKRLRGHAGRVANIILDIEHKYNCDYVKFDIENMKRGVRQMLYT